MRRQKRKHTVSHLGHVAINREHSPQQTLFMVQHSASSCSICMHQSAAAVIMLHKLATVPGWVLLCLQQVQCKLALLQPLTWIITKPCNKPDDASRATYMDILSRALKHDRGFLKSKALAVSQPVRRTMQPIGRTIGPHEHNSCSRGKNNNCVQRRYDHLKQTSHPMGPDQAVGAQGARA